MASDEAEPSGDSDPTEVGPAADDEPSDVSAPRPLPRPRPALRGLPRASFGYLEGDVVEGRYRLLSMLGTGGMGEVWRAHDETLEVDVALKLIRGESSSDAAERLLQEARAAAKLGHPAIVRVFDFGRTEQSLPFIVMELLEGEDLATYLVRRGRLSATKAVRMILPIAAALVAAHDKGIVHRDLKPENVFLAQQEDQKVQPKIVDFGVAKLDRENSRLTRTGAVLGSPAYMSPEQARGDDVDHRADVWSLCVVLYEMVTGRTPFVGKNVNATLFAITSNEPPPLAMLSAGDAELWTVLSVGMKKDADKRWQTMRDLGEALALWLRARGVSDDITGAALDATWHRRTVAAPVSSIPPPPGPQLDRAAETTVTSMALTARARVRTKRLFLTGALAVTALVGALWARGSGSATGYVVPSVAPAKTTSPTPSQQAPVVQAPVSSPAPEPSIEPEPSTPPARPTAASRKAKPGKPTPRASPAPRLRPAMKDPFL